MANKNWDNLIGSKTIAAGGYVGDLMAVARVHIKDALDKNEITQEQAGEIYTAMIPSAFQTGLAYAMK